jgi:outer membrane protein assembly factor BamA
LTDQKLKSSSPITEGAAFDSSQIQPALIALKQEYGRNGFRNAEVDYELVRDDAKSLVEIRFTIQEQLKSVIQSVKIEGEEKISEQFIRKQIELSEGRTQDVSATNRSIRRLYSTGAFARVDVENQPLPDLPASTQGVEPVNVTVRVQESRPYKFVYGGYFDSERGPGVIVEAEARNLLGNTRLLGLRTRLDRDYQEGRFYVTQPPLRQLPLQSTITGYWKDEKVQDAYDLRTRGVTFQQEGRLREKYLFSYGYRYERKRVFAFDDPRFQNFRLSSSSASGNSLSLSRDDYLDPTRGSFTLMPWSSLEQLGARWLCSLFRSVLQILSDFTAPVRPFGNETKPRYLRYWLACGSIEGLHARRHCVVRTLLCWRRDHGSRFRTGQIRTTGSLWKSARR